MKNFSDIYKTYTKDEFNKLFNNTYNYLYDNDIDDYGYYYTMQVYDYMIQHNDAFSLFIQLFITLRGDFLSSDREIRAIMVIFIKELKLKPVLKTIEKLKKDALK